MAESESNTVACAACGTVNRLRLDRILDDPVCGKCHAKVFPREPVEVSDASWAQAVVGCPIPVLVDFWAPWCGPCRMVAPVLEAIARERAGRLKVVKVNTDDNPVTANRFGIRSIPTMMLFQGGNRVDQVNGAMPKTGIDQWLGRHVR